MRHSSKVILTLAKCIHRARERADLRQHVFRVARSRGTERREILRRRYFERLQLRGRSREFIIQRLQLLLRRDIHGGERAQRVARDVLVLRASQRVDGGFQRFEIRLRHL